MHQLVTYLESQKLAGKTIELPSVTSVSSGAAYLPPELSEKASSMLGKDGARPEIGDGTYLPSNTIVFPFH
jgi:hypothetical protein